MTLLVKFIKLGSSVFASLLMLWMVDCIFSSLAWRSVTLGLRVWYASMAPIRLPNRCCVSVRVDISCAWESWSVLFVAFLRAWTFSFSIVVFSMTIMSE